MSEHWNVQIKVQRVVKTGAPNGGSRPGYVAAPEKRDVIEVLNLAVVADSEAEAYQKARRILDVTVGTVTE